MYIVSIVGTEKLKARRKWLMRHSGYQRNYRPKYPNKKVLHRLREPDLMDDRRLWEDHFCFPSFHNDLLSLTDQ
jgi:hypothetical protein